MDVVLLHVKGWMPAEGMSAPMQGFSVSLHVTYLAACPVVSRPS